MKGPRRHHYCPAGYLANFSEPVDRHGGLVVIDRETASERPSTPNNEAHQRDFYRIDTDPSVSDPFFLEKAFSDIETPALAAIRKTIDTNNLPNTEDLNWIINFIGLLFARVPDFREKWENFEKQIYSKILQMSVISKAHYESVVMKIKGGSDGPKANFEEMRDFIQGENFEIKVARNSILTAMLQSSAIATDLLQRRKWSLIVADCTEEFITCDSPVIVRWIKPMRGRFAPGLGVSNTEVSLTLSPRHLLTGVFEDLSGIFNVGVEGVASTNEYLYLKSKRWLYSRSGNPVLYNKDRIATLKERLSCNHLRV
ncbi:MAG: DUF4238 domain-containing protein [Oligoflexales bacterium]